MGYIIFIVIITFLYIAGLVHFLKNKRYLDEKRRNFNKRGLILGGISLIVLIIILVIKLV
jgi:uncharacterized membrane protein